MSEEKLATLARKQFGVFSRAQAIEAGLRERTVRRRVATGTWHRYDNGVYRFPGAIETWHTKVMAATLALGHGAMASHRTAAHLWDLDLRGGAPIVIETTARKSSGQRTRRAKVHRTRRLPDAVLRSGIPATPLARTLLDLSQVLDARDLHRALDAARRKHGDIIASVGEELRATAIGRRAEGPLKLAAALIDAGKMPHTDTALEGDAAFDLIRSGLPIPTPQHVIRDAEGAHVARVDFAWLQHRVVLLADSREWHLHAEGWEKDVAQRRKLESLGWRVVGVTKRGLREGSWIREVGDLLAEVDPFGILANAPLWGG